MDDNFEINSYLLIKMGWRYPNFYQKNNVPKNHQNSSLRFFFDDNLSKTCFLIKQNDEKKYKLLVIDYSVKSRVKKTISINSNAQLFKIISEFECCNDDYKRHFKLNKIFRK